MAGTTIIVGATGGVGSALARRLAARGVALHLVARDTVRLKPLAGETSATFDVADVLDSEALTKAVQAAEGPVEGLVYAVGSIKLKPLHAFHPTILWPTSPSTRWAQQSQPGGFAGDEGECIAEFSRPVFKRGRRAASARSPHG